MLALYSIVVHPGKKSGIHLFGKQLQACDQTIWGTLRSSGVQDTIPLAR